MESSSAVHPESYAVVEKIAEKNSRPISNLMGDSGFLRGLKAIDYTDEKFGLPTVTDIISELDKPGRDPRPEFKTAKFQEGVEKISDLVPGMILEGTVTNVTNFGAFVDVGVHQDGLVHISALSNSFVKDPREVVKAGDIVKVKVMEVDAPRKRIGMSMRLDDTPSDKASVPGERRPSRRPAGSVTSQRSFGENGGGNNKGNSKGSSEGGSEGTMAALFTNANKNKKGRL